jgi:hypothetical protein
MNMEGAGFAAGTRSPDEIDNPIALGACSHVAECGSHIVRLAEL